MPKLNDKQKAFAHEWLKDFNATKSAERAGYSKKTAYSQGQRLLKHVEIQKLIQGRQKKRSEKLNVDAEYVLKRHIEIDKMDMVDILNDDCSIKPIKEWPKIWRQFVSGVDITEISRSGEDQEVLISLVKKIKWPDKLRNLELLGKHIDISAYSNNHNVSLIKSDEDKIIEKMSLSFSIKQIDTVFKHVKEKEISITAAYELVLSQGSD